jgi:hypothetical protein
MVTINWPAVSLAMVLGVVVGALWYSKPLFGGAWQRLSNLDDAALKQGFMPRLALAVCANLASAWCLAGFFNFTHSNSFFLGALAGLELCVGLVAPSMALEHVFGRRSPKLLAINLGHAALVLALQGGLLASWK